MKMHRIALALLMVLVLLPVAFASAELAEWQNDEVGYQDVTVAKGEMFTVTGYLMLAERGYNEWTGENSKEMVVYFYPDRPLNIAAEGDNGEVTRAVLDCLQVVSYENMAQFDGQRVTVTGLFASADEGNQYATLIALVDPTIQLEQDSVGFALDAIDQIGWGMESDGNANDGFAAYIDMPDSLIAETDSAQNSGAGAYVLADGGNSNVRNQPNLNGKHVFTLKEGEKASYLGKSSWDDRNVEWYYISYQGERGWVSTKYTTLVGGTSSGSAGGGFPVNATYGYVYADGGHSNLRKGPGLSYKTYCTFKEDSYAVYMNESRVDERGVTWYRIYYNGYDGWVSSRYTSLFYYGNAYDQDVEAIADVYVRLGPGLHYGICDVLRKGEIRDYLGGIYYDDRGVAWYRVSCRTGAGWVSSRYTTFR